MRKLTQALGDGSGSRGDLSRALLPGCYADKMPVDLHQLSRAKVDNHNLLAGHNGFWAVCNLAEPNVVQSTALGFVEQHAP